jgi:peroxiredoxin/glycine cleavage system regulatory protein
MKELIVICAIGSDRTGLVYDVTRVILDCGGNVLESRMTAMGNEFAMLLLVSGQWHTLTRLENEFKKLSDATSINVTIRRTETRSPRPDAVTYSVDVVCLDQPGVVFNLAGFFSSRGIDIGDVSTRNFAAAHTGASMFHADDCACPANSSRLREEFMELCDHNFDDSRTPRLSADSPTHHGVSNEQAIGKAAPGFAAGTGQTLTLGTPGKHLVVYFYPRDNPPGCTTETAAFRDLYPQFKKTGTDIVGISADSVASHEKFKAKLQLPFELLSDAEHTVCQLFEVYKEKSLYGRKFMGIERSTFLIDSSGKLQYEWRKVKVPGHAEAVLAEARKL